MFNVYSMLTVEERVNLHNLAKNIPLESNDCILEFGVFFGGSTEALGKGLALNETHNDQKVIAIDTFSCSKTGEFYNVVLERSKQIGALAFLELTDRTVDWYQFVQQNLSDIPNLDVKQIDARNYVHSGESIALLHLDLPKHYNEMYEILSGTLKYVKSDAFIIFQDFFYQWSAEIIGFISYLIKHKKVEFQYAQDPTLAVKNCKLDQGDLDFYRENLGSYEFVRDLLWDAIEFLDGKISVSQQETIYMALFQFATKGNDLDTIHKLMKLIHYPELSPNVMRIFNELKKYNFDIKSLYNNDFIDLPFEQQKSVDNDILQKQIVETTPVSITQEQYEYIQKAEREQRQQIENSIAKVHLEDKHIRHCQMLVNREALLKRLPKDAVVAEIGVDKGSFSKDILRLAQPQKLHLVDIWGSERYHDGLFKSVTDTFQNEIASEQIVINRALSLEAVSMFNDHYFDWIYIDTDHSYSTTRQELEQYQQKVKPGGIIAGHDYAKGNMVNFCRYGVIEAVHEFCINFGWEIIFLTVDYVEQPSFAIRKIV